MTEGLIIVASGDSFTRTLDGLIAGLTRRGVEIFAQIDHAANARAAGLELRPTTVVVFGAAKAGTPLMTAEQMLGLDLPLRALVYEDAQGKAWIAYNQPEWIAARQGLNREAFPSIGGMARLLEAVVAEATAEGPVS